MFAYLMCRLHVYSWWLLLPLRWRPGGQQPLPSSDLPSTRRHHQALQPHPPSLHWPPSTLHPSPAVSPPAPPCVLHVQAALPLAPLRSETPGWGEAVGGTKPQTQGLCHSQPRHPSLSSAPTSSSHQPPFCPFRKRTHSPSSKDEQSIGLKDSLLAHSSDPVEMRRLNYQTPGRVASQPTCLQPGPAGPGVYQEPLAPCPHFLLFFPAAHSLFPSTSLK